MEPQWTESRDCNPFKPITEFGLMLYLLAPVGWLSSKVGRGDTANNHRLQKNVNSTLLNERLYLKQWIIIIRMCSISKNLFIIINCIYEAILDNIYLTKTINLFQVQAESYLYTHYRLADVGFSSIYFLLLFTYILKSYMK